MDKAKKGLSLQINEPTSAAANQTLVSNLNSQYTNASSTDSQSGEAEFVECGSRGRSKEKGVKRELDREMCVFCVNQCSRLVFC